MSFIYPRVISISRPSGVNGIGNVGYSTPQTATILQGIQASIQLKKESGGVPVRLPGDARKVTYWNIYFKAPLGSVLDRDIVTDDLGQRYQVTAAYWNSLGCNILCERLES